MIQEERRLHLHPTVDQVDLSPHPGGGTQDALEYHHPLCAQRHRRAVTPRFGRGRAIPRVEIAHGPALAAGARSSRAGVSRAGALARTNPPLFPHRPTHPLRLCACSSAGEYSSESPPSVGHPATAIGAVRRGHALPALPARGARVAKLRAEGMLFGVVLQHPHEQWRVQPNLDADPEEARELARGPKGMRRESARGRREVEGVGSEGEGAGEGEG